MRLHLHKTPRTGKFTETVDQRFPGLGREGNERGSSAAHLIRKGGNSHQVGGDIQEDVVP